MLGKRTHTPTIRRTTSMTAMTLESHLTNTDPQQPQPMNQELISDIPTSPFLRTCGLCKRPLAGRDIYMYRGDTAFCSLECREQQIKHDETQQKWKMASKKQDASSSSSSPAPTSNASSATTETVAAA